MGNLYRLSGSWSEQPFVGVQVQQANFFWCLLYFDTCRGVLLLPFVLLCQFCSIVCYCWLVVLGGFLSFSVREALHFCNYFLQFLLETLFCHWFVINLLEWEWPDFHVLLMMYSDISAFLSLLVTELLILFQIIFAFDMSALCQAGHS